MDDQSIASDQSKQETPKRSSTLAQPSLTGWSILHGGQSLYVMKHVILILKRIWVDPRGQKNEVNIFEQIV